MGVHFVYRCHYAGPSEKHVRHFPEDDTVLAFFRRVWRPIADQHEAYRYAEEVLGFSVYSAGGLFMRIAEKSLPPPATQKELHGALGRGLYVNEMTCSEHAVQVYTDDDELEMALYFLHGTRPGNCLCCQRLTAIPTWSISPQVLIFRTP
jgi:hypothetical protein